MATRSNIELYDGHRVGAGDFYRWTLGVRLYHHFDGYPEWMGPELERILSEVRSVLTQHGSAPRWWDSERVGALMIRLSADNDVADYYQDVPRFQPCQERHGDINYIWKVYLKSDATFDIECYQLQFDGQDYQMGTVQKIDWRQIVADEAAKL